MAKKKSVRKASKKVAKKSTRKISKRVSPKTNVTQPIIKPVKATSKKFNIAFRSFALFLILTLISGALYFSTIEGTMYNNLFEMLTILMGVVTLAFVLVILILLLLRILGK